MRLLVQKQQKEMNEQPETTERAVKRTTTTLKKIIIVSNRPSSITVDNSNGKLTLNSSPIRMDAISKPVHIYTVNMNGIPRIGEVCVDLTDEKDPILIKSYEKEMENCFPVLKTSDCQIANVAKMTVTNVCDYIEKMGGLVISHKISGLPIRELYTDLKKD